ncbi:hypothetical protein [Heyndrickxia coagulans]|uniref:hypothetical protein n=1 Tax=Heyndrickxia coagulans TaxID=1398 RepID=UPI0014593E21|nr:hypothetical protein [Heyndrickxia coagulans]NMH82914.1 hypothetical protein [Heyndrickxia coagulans]
MVNKYAIFIVALIFFILAVTVKPVFELIGWNLPDRTLNMVAVIFGLLTLCISLITAVIAVIDFKK